mgnify:CR=1 FL=1
MATLANEFMVVADTKIESVTFAPSATADLDREGIVSYIVYFVLFKITSSNTKPRYLMLQFFHGIWLWSCYEPMANATF